MEIKEFLADESNFTKNRIRAIKYIVVHYTGNNGDTAKGNCNFSSAPNRNKSAHYFVDENSVYRSVRDLSVAWHCGATKYVHPLCRNSNSIGVEMCSRIDKNGKYYIKKETVENTIWLVKTLMKKYDVPVENVLRHYDVSGKICPEPFVRVESDWNDFKKRLGESEMEKRYNKISELPAWAKPTIQKLVDGGKIADRNKLDLSEDMVRVLVIMNR